MAEGPCEEGTEAPSPVPGAYELPSAGWGIRVGSSEAIQHLLGCPGWPGVGAGAENPSGPVQVLETTPFQGTQSKQELVRLK